jgi:uncharacterized protein YeeX (DUF496 family)
LDSKEEIKEQLRKAVVNSDYVDLLCNTFQYTKAKFNTNKILKILYSELSEIIINQ